MDNNENNYWEAIDHNFRLVELSMLDLKTHIDRRTNNAFRDEVGCHALSVLNCLKSIETISSLMHKQKVMEIYYTLPAPVVREKL